VWSGVVNVARAIRKKNLDIGLHLDEVRRERRPTRVMLLADSDSRMVCQGHVLCGAAGTPPSFRHADYSFKSVRLSRSSRGSTHRSLPFACFVRSLTWSISDVKHVSGCGGWDRLSPMPDMQTTKGRDVRRPILSASCWQLRYMSVSRHWYVAAARACRADHCEVGRDHFVQFLRRVWQLQYMSASQRGCM